MRHHRKLTLPCHRARGFSLLEVLISMVVLSIGLLGLAGLQTMGLRNNHSAYLRSQATLLAYDIADRMRANRRTAIDDGSYSLTLNATPATPAKDCTTTTCAPAELAAYDLYHWFKRLTAVLPAGDSSIQLNSGVVTVTLQWDETWAEIWAQKEQKNNKDSEDNNTPITQEFAMSTVL